MNLTIPEIRAAKATMEQAIANAVAPALDAFQQQTGLRVDEVRVVLVTVDGVGKHPYSVVDQVETEIDLQL